MQDIAGTLDEAGDQSGAKAVLTQALAAAEKLEGRDRVSASRHIAEALAKVDDKAGAKAVLTQALAAAEKLWGEDKATALGEIAWAMVSTGDKAGAIDFAENLKYDDKVRALSVIVMTLATEEGVVDANGKVIKDVEGRPKLKMRKSFAPEDKSLVARLVALLAKVESQK